MTGSNEHARTERRAFIPAAACLAAVLPALVLLAGCESLGSISEIGTAMGVATGKISESDAASINRSAQAVEKSFEDITPEQEYYIGRAVSAVILDDYKPYDREAAMRYINILGRTLALVSSRPETFSGYHFLILDSDEINAFAAPSGFIFVSRGLLRLAKNEDMVAAVLAHEIAHVELNHGLKSIKKSRLTTALTSVALTAAQTAGPKELAELTTAFEGSIGDITATLVNSGYSQAYELEADRAASIILAKAGYDPAALAAMIEAMKQPYARDKRGFGKTHPNPDDRLKTLAGAKIKAPPAPLARVLTARERRFRNALAGI